MRHTIYNRTYGSRELRLEIELDEERQSFIQWKNDQTRGDRVSYIYVWWKSWKLYHWLLGLNVMWDKPYDGLYGSLAGYKYLHFLVAEVERQCVYKGIKCYALVDMPLIDLEGQRVIACLKDGRSVEGFVKFIGKYIKASMIAKKMEYTLGVICRDDVVRVTVLA